MLSVLTLIVAALVFALAFDLLGMPKKGTQTKSKTPQKTQTARVVANGDILIHDILYMSAKKADGSYDFNPYFERSEEHTSELQSRQYLVCRLLLEKKKTLDLNAES